MKTLKFLDNLQGSFKLFHEDIINVLISNLLSVLVDVLKFTTSQYYFVILFVCVYVSICVHMHT
jgi:hypothetical protein